MLQKIENFYLAILRFVVIVAAGLLLIAVALLAAKSVTALRSAPVIKEEAPQVSQEIIKKSVLNTDNSTQTQLTTSGNGSSPTDPNNIYYARVAASITKFFDVSFPGQYKLDQGKITKVVKERTDTYDTDALKASYAKAFAESMEALLSDPAIIQYAKTNQVSETIEKIINSFTNEFNKQVKVVQAKKQEKQAAYLEEKANAQQNLYTAAAGFGIFLLIVFLSIIIRIERNLRPENRAA